MYYEYFVDYNFVIYFVRSVRYQFQIRSDVVRKKDDYHINSSFQKYVTLCSAIFLEKKYGKKLDVEKCESS